MSRNYMQIISATNFKVWNMNLLVFFKTYKLFIMKHLVFIMRRICGLNNRIYC